MGEAREFFHVRNTGIEMKKVFGSPDDKVQFITQMCETSFSLDVKIHSFALSDFGYDIVLEASPKTVSKYMQILNMRYSRYYNKKNVRRGYLWEGRYRSWRIDTVEQMLEAIVFIESIPYRLGLEEEMGDYMYASFRQFLGSDALLPCLKGTIIFEVFDSADEIKSFFSKNMDTKNIYEIHSASYRGSKKYQQKEKQKDIALYFKNVTNKKERDIMIYKVYKNGHTQVDIAKFLGITQQAVHKIVKRLCSHGRGKYK